MDLASWRYRPAMTDLIPTESAAAIRPRWLVPVLVAVESDKVGAAAVDLLEESHASLELDELIEIVFVEAHAKVNEVDLRGHVRDDYRSLSD